MRKAITSAVMTTVVVALVGGCGSPRPTAQPVTTTAPSVTVAPVTAWPAPHPSPAVLGSLSAGFLGAVRTPAPESTITPAPGSWDHVRPARGYRVVLLTAGDDPQTAVLRSAVTTWAHAVGANVKTVTATASDVDAAILRAVDLAPDVVISAGNLLIDPLALSTASNLQQQFLVVGAELAEPTENVTAADWLGASFRGEGLGASSTYDPTSFTPERAGRAVRAGVAAVLTGHRGIVVQLS